MYSSQCLWVGVFCYYCFSISAHQSCLACKYLPLRQRVFKKLLGVPSLEEENPFHPVPHPQRSPEGELGTGDFKPGPDSLAGPCVQRVSSGRLGKGHQEQRGITRDQGGDPRALELPVTVYGRRSWTARKADRKDETDSFKIQRWRAALRTPWTSGSQSKLSQKCHRKQKCQH